jgi:streptogramin lyase
MMIKKYLVISVFLSLPALLCSQSDPEYSWRYYRPGNTGILGDYSEAIWIDHDGDPYIAAFTPGWEEGGFSKYLQSENRWINYSNLEYPVMGSVNDVGSSRISDIVEDSEGIFWMATWRGILKFDPSIGGSSLEFWGSDNSVHPGGRTKDIDVAPDGSVWAAVISVEWGFGGLIQFDPATNEWQYWGYGSTANNWPSLIGQCEHLSIQAKPGGGYLVWIDGEGWNTMITYDSETELFTLLPQNYVNGEVVSLPGNDCVDDEGNLWAMRVTQPGDPFSLDYRQPDGTWVTPVQPTSVISDIWAFQAFGNHEALISGYSNEIFQFDGTSWESKGVWDSGTSTNALDIDDAGNIWVTGTGGSARRDAGNGNWQRHRVTNSSQIDYWVEDITIDDQGNIWMTGNAGSGAGGFQMFDGTRWTGFNEFTYGLGYPFPFPTDNSEAILYRPSNGQVVINPMFNNLHSWDGSSYTTLNYPETRSRGLAEDSQGKLWSLGEYYSLHYYNDANSVWTPVDFVGIGANIRRDPDLPGTVWASSFYQVMRTDGNNHYVKVLEDFPELDPQSDFINAVIPGPDGIAWVGSNQGLFRLDAGSDAYQFFSPSNSSIPGESITPLAVTPDGRIWFSNFGSVDTTRMGLCWYDGAEFGVLPVEAGGLPHAQIPDMEIKELPNGYELWMSCLSQGIAVLTVITDPVGLPDQILIARAGSVMAYPNPAKEVVEIVFQSGNENARVLIYDIAGRLVNEVSGRSTGDGDYYAHWNLAGRGGARVKPGIYFAAIEGARQLAPAKIIVQ